MKPVLSIEAFADWCEKQPPEKGYVYADVCNCACGQYAQSLGLNHWSPFDSEFWFAADNEASWTDERTFGALAARLRAVQS